VGRSPWTAVDAPVGLRFWRDEGAGPSRTGGPARTRASALPSIPLGRRLNLVRLEQMGLFLEASGAKAAGR